ncbi:MAG: hypothetical protein KGJ79_13400 [Alphaproteobacteria bacterium]|nr:hypothetical protein [Alphaproteobacteria bacterium]MDE2112134.1 hypothetical protein [Alphaproteobacteria bacterium]MDE2493932.1 hypothetical protein [Alphaproteobacteria bacterium]
MPNAPALRAGAHKRVRMPNTENCPKPIDAAFIDNIVHDLFQALKRQLVRFQKMERRPRAGRETAPAAVARALAAMELTLERLLKVERQREEARKMRAAENQTIEEARAQLEARLDARLADFEENQRRREEEEWRKAQEAIDSLALMGIS